MSRSGPSDAPLLGPGDFDPILGLGRGQVSPGAGGYGHQANVGGILPPGGRGGPADLTTPVFLAAGAANYFNRMQGVAPGGASFNPFGRGMISNQGFGELGAQGLPVPPPPVAGQPIFRTPRRRLPLRRKSTPLRAHCHPERQLKKKTHVFWRFCGARNASLRHTFCCVVHQKRDFKAHPAASTTLLVGSPQLAADSRLSTRSYSTLDLGSLSTLETHNPATACVDSEASSSTVALGKAFSMVATTRFIVCDPHASSFLILRSGTRDPN